MDEPARSTDSPEQRATGPTILTSGEVCEVLKIEPYQLSYLLETKQVPPPRKTLLGRRLYYTEQDLQRIKDRLKVREIRARIRGRKAESSPKPVLPG